MFQHHDAREDHRAWVDLVEVGVFRRGAVGRLENGVAGEVVDVATGRDADAAHLRGQCIGEVVAVQVQGRNDVELVGTGEHLLQGDVRDGVLEQNLARGRLAPTVIPSNHAAGVLALGQGVAPVTERALGELHDVALVDHGHALALV